jgi:hypothetical protein
MAWQKETELISGPILFFFFHISSRRNVRYGYIYLHQSSAEGLSTLKRRELGLGYRRSHMQTPLGSPRQ